MSAGQDFETATRYLRGELDDLDRTVFEERLLGDESVHELVLAAEDELLDAHVAGALDGEVRARFDQRLKAEPALRRRRQLAAGLFQRAAAGAVVPRAAKPATVPGWRRWAMPAVAALVAAAIALFYLSRQPRPPEVVTLALASPTRSSAIPELAVAHGTRTVRLALEVPATPPPVVTVTGPRGPVAVKPVSGATVELDAAALVPGLHEIDAGGVIFQLRIVRR